MLILQLLGDLLKKILILSHIHSSSYTSHPTLKKFAAAKS